MRFDEPYYTRINAARWAMTEKLLRDVQSSCGIELATCLDVRILGQPLSRMSENVSAAKREELPTSGKSTPGLEERGAGPSTRARHGSKFMVYGNVASGGVLRGGLLRQPLNVQPFCLSFAPACA